MAVVTSAQGILKGRLATTENGTNYYEFLSVPYAKPPIGDLRFKSPQPVQPWQGEKDVSKAYDTTLALQKDILGIFGGQVIGSEDCLYLNVFTPTLPKANAKVKLPVMVYVHGGGFVVGNGTMKDENGPDYLLEHNVIIISINYRLNVFGFLSLDIPEVAGNMGLKDQVFALKWVQDNIENFGGDKENVTLFGISAGSASVEYHILSPASQGLFHKAILQSGSSLNYWAINYEPQKLLNYLLKELNYTGDVNDKKAVYDFLFHAEGRMLVEAGFNIVDNYIQNYLSFGFVPTIEKDFGNGEAFLTTSPYVVLREGKFNKVPVIRGFCSKEGYLTKYLKPHVYAKMDTTEKSLLDHWPYQLSSIDTNKYNTKLYEEYFKKENNDEARIDFYSDFDFVAGIQVAANLTAKQRVPQHVYAFSYNGSLNKLKSMLRIKEEGAAHGDDTGYVLNMKWPAEWKITDTDRLVSKRITTMWTNFAKHGDPTPTTDDVIPQRWPEYTNESPVYVDIGKDVEVVRSGGYEPGKIAVFEDIYSKYEK